MLLIKIEQDLLLVTELIQNVAILTGVVPPVPQDGLRSLFFALLKDADNVLRLRVFDSLDGVLQDCEVLIAL